MAYGVIQQGDTVQYNVYDVVCDTLQEKDELPVEKWNPGSTCIVLEDNSVWMLGNDGQMHKL